MNAANLPATTAPNTALDDASDDARWAAVQQRDAGADGRFVYAVRTTGVYCRPSCGARAALRANVRFYADCAAAELAGFRACLRCKPRLPPLAERHAQAVAQACHLLDSAGAGEFGEFGDTAPNLDQLAEACGMSRFHFHRDDPMLKARTKAYSESFERRRR